MSRLIMIYSLQKHYFGLQGWKVHFEGRQLFQIPLYANRILMYFCIKSSIWTQGEVG